MQAFNFALRQSSADSVDDNRSRYVPSSIYSGPGPAEESPLPPQPVYPKNGANGTYTLNGSTYSNGTNGVRNTHQSVQSNAYAQSLGNRKPHMSVSLNLSDPVALHLLAETALSDSRDYEILSFEELEHYKRNRVVLRNRIAATKRKLALECKLRDAAQSLDRLYKTPQGSIDADNQDDRGHSRSFTGSKSSNNEAVSRAHDEFSSSSQRVEAMTQELKKMELALEDTQRRVLEHTAGVLQLTHRGLKKNLRKSELPRSPESMASPRYRRFSGQDPAEDFDERSLYPVPDYVHDFVQSNPVTPIFPSTSKFENGTKVFEEIATQLQDLNTQVHDMIKQFHPSEIMTPTPPPVELQKQEGASSQVQAQIERITASMAILSKAQQHTLLESDNVNAGLHKMLERTNSMSRSPHIGEDESRGEGLASQLTFSTKVLGQLHTRVETLVGQKDILTRQIQQQRELNTKSDAQRDAQIRDLTEELEETKRNQIMAQQEAQESQNQVSMLIEQLDRTKHDVMLMEQQKDMSDNKALQAERDARKTAEKELLDDVAAKQQINVQLQADMAKMQADFELRSQQHIQQVNDLSAAKDETSSEAKRHHTEAEKLLEQMAALQTELTIVKAELDGAYGTRAQRAADVSLNPAIQKEIDSLSSRNAELQKELKDTIEDYEQMTKASIEFEKERDQFESSIDRLRERCESLESQLSEEKLKWLGAKAQAPTETTSTMVLKNEFKKMMRDTRSENLKALKAEQEERRRLESLIRHMRKEAGLATPAKSVVSSYLSAGPSTPSKS